MPLHKKLKTLSPEALKRKQDKSKQSESNKRKRTEEDDDNKSNIGRRFSLLLGKPKKARLENEKDDDSFAIPVSVPSKKSSKSVSSIESSPGGSDLYDSTPQDSTDISFTDELSLSGDDPSSSVVDDFAQNKLEIKFDQNTQSELSHKILQIKSDTNKDNSTEECGVIYLGHIPHGFYEGQMKSFFSQFGTVNTLVIVRSKRTGKSKGFAFIEFEDPRVAKIVASTMNNYLMFGRRLISNVVPPNKVNHHLLDSKRSFLQVDWHELSRYKTNLELTPQRKEKCISRLLKNEQELREKINNLGIDYKFGGFAAIVGLISD